MSTIENLDKTNLMKPMGNYDETLCSFIFSLSNFSFFFCLLVLLFTLTGFFVFLLWCVTQLMLLANEKHRMHTTIMRNVSFDCCALLHKIIPFLLTITTYSVQFANAFVCRKNVIKHEHKCASREGAKER